MAVALSSSGVAFHLHSPSFSSSSGLSLNRFFFRDRNVSPCGVALPVHRVSRSVLVFARGKNRKGFATPSSSSSKRNKKKSFGGGDKGGGEEDELGDDPFEALFNLLEEDLKNDKSSIDDEELSEEALDALAAELAEALGVGDDMDDIELFGSATGDVVDDEDNGDYEDNSDDDDEDNVDDDDESEEEERPTKLKNWQLRRLAYALKAGRRKTSIKNLAAEICVDRAYVLELLREPPPKLLMLSATLPDEKPPVAAPENSSADPILVESPSSSAEDDVVEPKEKVKDEAVHVMQQRWSSQKRVKKAHIETLEKVYRRSKRPTNAVVSSIVQVTNLPRKRVLKWFEDKRAEDGVPDKRSPYQAPV